MEFIVIIIVLVIGGFLLRKNWKSKFNCIETIPGPKPLPLFGNALSFEKPSDILPKFGEFSKQYGSTFRLWIGPSLPYIVTKDYKLIEVLLSSSKQLRKAFEYSYFDRWLGQGLLISEKSKWRKHRKILTPAFHFQILVKFVDMFERPTSVLIEKLQKKIGLSSFDVFSLLNLYSLDVMCETSMGTRVDAQKNEESEYVNAVKDMSRIIMERSFSPAKANQFLYKFSRDYRIEKKAVEILHGYTESVIKKRKEELMKNGEDVDISQRKKPTFLDILLLSKVDGEPLSDEAIRDEVDTFMFEGHDTTSSAVSFALYAIAMHPDVQEKLLDEQINIFGKSKNPTVCYNDLQNMKYLELVIKESLRLYPPVPIFGRNLEEDFILNGQLYPEGLNCQVFAFGLLRDSKFFPNPEEFIPTRFLDVRSENPFSYIPFSAGPRNCIGQKFAMLELKFAISAVLRNFELCAATPAEKPFLVAQVILRSLNGIKIKIKERIY